MRRRFFKLNAEALLRASVEKDKRRRITPGGHEVERDGFKSRYRGEARKRKREPHR